ncbi:MAG: hypothetical protein V4631_22165 [Pseudomonadota bacterium]
MYTVLVFSRPSWALPKMRRSLTDCGAFFFADIGSQHRYYLADDGF